jgi:hypothetical protein
VDAAEDRAGKLIATAANLLGVTCMELIDVMTLVIIFIVVASTVAFVLWLARYTWLNYINLSL